VRRLAALAACVFLSVAFPARAGEGEDPRDVLAAYLAASRAGDRDAAASCWLPADLDRSESLGVAYRGVPLKLDASSHLMTPGVAAAGEPEIGPPAGHPDDGPLRFTVTFPTTPAPVTSDYVAIREDGRWWLASPSTALAGDWPVTETRYLRFRVQPGRPLLRRATDELDLFVEEVGARLGISPSAMERLAAEKIDYLLCDEKVVEAIAGAPTRGVAMLPVDAVVTSEPFHTHELAHLLVGYAAWDLGLYSLPALQEGIAVHLGGRWGRSPAVLEELGRYVLANDFAPVEGFLSWKDFRDQLPDLVYAPAGILAGYLLEDLGPEGFLDLYRDSSGWPDALAARSGPEIQADLERRLGLDPGGLSAALAAHLETLAGGGIEPGGDEVRGDARVLKEGGLEVGIVTGEEWILFDVRAESGDPAGSVLLGPAGDPADPGRLYAERFPGREYRGETGAVVFGPGEAGYYDFGTDILVAKYVHDFRPDPAFRPGDDDRVVFRVRRDVLPAGPLDWTLVTTP